MLTMIVIFTAKYSLNNKMESILLGMPLKEFFFIYSLASLSGFNKIFKSRNLFPYEENILRFYVTLTFVGGLTTTDKKQNFEPPPYDTSISSRERPHTRN